MSHVYSVYTGFYNWRFCSAHAGTRGFKVCNDCGGTNITVANK